MLTSAETQSPPAHNDLPRANAYAAVIEGFFAALWFSWGRADAPAVLSVAYLVLGVVGMGLLVAGVLAARRAPVGTSPLADPVHRRRYNITVGLEFLVAFLGSAALGRAEQAEWIPVWVCAVVGLHFFPLARLFPGIDLPLLGAVVTAVAVVALVVGLTTDVAPGTVTGGGAGLALLVAGVLALTGRRVSPILTRRR